jgi:hypothetical protein
VGNYADVSRVYYGKKKPFCGEKRRRKPKKRDFLQRAANSETPFRSRLRRKATRSARRKPKKRDFLQRAAKPKTRRKAV